MDEREEEADKFREFVKSFGLEVPYEKFDLTDLEMKNELKKYHYDLMYPGKMINPLTTFMDAKNVAKFQPNPARRPIKISSRVKKGFSPPTSVLQEEEHEESDTNDIPDAHERSEVVSSMAMSPKGPSRL